MTDEAKEEGKVVGATEEVWGDAEIGYVLKEAAASWDKEVGYKEELAGWVDEYVGEFVEYLGLGVDECEHKIHFSDLHEAYLGIFERQITKFVKREVRSDEERRTAGRGT